MNQPHLLSAGLHEEPRDFPKSKRLLKRLEYKRVLDGGRKVVCSEMIVIGIARTEGTRLGLIVSKKVGNAAVRNRIKRQLREIFRNQKPEIPYDLVVIARQSATLRAYDQLVAAFVQCCGRLQKRDYPRPSKHREGSRPGNKEPSSHVDCPKRPL